MFILSRTQILIQVKCLLGVGVSTGLKFTLMWPLAYWYFAGNIDLNFDFTSNDFQEEN